MFSMMAGSALLALTSGAMAADPAPAPAPAPMAAAPPAAATAGAPYAAPGAGDWQQGQAPYAGYAYSAPQPMGPPMGPPMDRRGYHQPQRGASFGDVAHDPAYAVQDWQQWGLNPPGYGMHWMRYYDDAVLVDGYGRVVDVRPGVNWGGPRPGPMPGMGPMGPMGGPGYGGQGYAWHDGHGGTTVYHAGPNTTVTTQVVGGGPAPYGYGGGYGFGYGGGYAVGAGTLIITPGSVITTTTTTSEEMVYHHARRAWRAPVRHYRPRCLPKAPACPVEAPVVGS